ncbi:hypothetical protein CISIN_1g0350521mg, partial [Citrus sinensis]
MNLLH